MYFVPLSQLESVELLVHGLKAAAGEADCSMCPARKVCMKQCLTIAGAIEKMLLEGALPQVGNAPAQEMPEMEDDPGPDSPSGGVPAGGARLKIVK